MKSPLVKTKFTEERLGESQWPDGKVYIYIYNVLPDGKVC